MEAQFAVQQNHKKLLLRFVHSLCICFMEFTLYLKQEYKCSQSYFKHKPGKWQSDKAAKGNCTTPYFCRLLVKQIKLNKPKYDLPTNLKGIQFLQ